MTERYDQSSAETPSRTSIVVLVVIAAALALTSIWIGGAGEVTRRDTAGSMLTGVFALTVFLQAMNRAVVRMEAHRHEQEIREAVKDFDRQWESGRWAS